ncbi:hypothetical protein DQ04_01151070 [Trypanosoma grayi]|uniref:hypothetical protein n=1 Tax=Trypanosoma grayi TaxID=71804 RepID=UPI0004F430F4|nr:hypothetical protein DQ04_01151070 [Trypanosoma grayi]KEG13200.1 hypothetical protein DQ04_01151070 [Trypanosoma grayi]
MDPAAGVFSPFHNEAEGKNGLLESAVEELGATGHSADASAGQREGGRKNSKPKDDDASRRGAPCGWCGQNYTTVTVPAGGLYLCAVCAAQREAKPQMNPFPPNTLKCCPASVTEGDSGVVRCYACHGWYHFACLEIHDKALKEHLSLSTTKWYCLEPSCCEKVLQEKLRRRR